MGHRAKIDLETKLLAVRDDLLARATAAIARHTERVAAARAHRVDPAAAGAALEAIAKSRSYRLGGHRTFDAFARAELGFSRMTAHRLRARAAAPASGANESEAAARTLRRWLLALGVGPVSVIPHRRSSRVTVVLDAAAVRALTATRPRKRG